MELRGQAAPQPAGSQARRSSESKRREATECRVPIARRTDTAEGDAQRQAGSRRSDQGEVQVLQDDAQCQTVEPLGELERAVLRELPDYDEELKRELGLLRTEGGGASLAERLLLPSLTVRGLASANVGALARNIIPATATAALGIRLVKGNDPEQMRDLVETHIRRQGYHIVREDPDRETRLRYPKIAKVTRSGVIQRLVRQWMCRSCSKWFAQPAGRPATTWCCFRRWADRCRCTCLPTSWGSRR